MNELGDFFSLIGEEKNKKEEKKKELIGELSLGDLFASLSEEKKKIKEKNEKKDKEREELIKNAKIFETFLFSDTKKQQKEEVDTTDRKDNYVPTEIETTNIIKPEPLKQEKVEEKAEISENIEKTINILDKLIPEEEKINDSETEMSRLKREVDQLRKMVYESVRTATAQGGGGEVRLEFLDDVDRNTAKTDGLYLKYDETLDKWVGAPVGGGATTFTDLTDVDSSTKNGNSVVYNSGTGKFIGTDILGNFRELISENVSDGDVVVYSASAGRFIATSQGSLTGTGRTTLVTLDDVVGIPSTNNVLIFNGTDFEFTTPFEIVDRSDGSDDDILDYGSF